MAELPTREEMEAYVRAGAARRRMDPDFWAKVVEGESGWNPAARARTAKEDSGGLMQLNTKGGLGVGALERGIDPHNPEQWKQQVDYGLDEGKKSYKPWTVARQLKGEATPGIPTNPVARGSKVADAAAPRRPDGAPGPADTPTLPQNVDKGVLSALYSPFEKIAEQAKEQEQAQQKTAENLQQVNTEALAQLRNAVPVPAPPAPPPVPAPMPQSSADFAAVMLPRIRRGLLADTSNYGLLS